MSGCLSKCINESCYEVLHTWDENCLMATLKMVFWSYRYCLKLYTPFYFVTALIARKKKVYFFKKIYIDILRSSAFLSSNAVFLVIFYCFFRKLFGNFNILNAGFLPGFWSSFVAIIIERESRRTPLASYMFNQALDIAYTTLKLHGLEKYSYPIEVSLLSVSMAVLTYMHRTKVMPAGYVKSAFELKASARAFGFGYGVQTAYYLLVAILRIFRNPELIPMSFIKKASLKTAAFFGSMVAIIRFLETMLTKYMKSDLKYLLAGACAGGSMIFNRSPYIVIYIFSKMCELVYFFGQEKGYFPYNKHSNVFLYSLFTGYMIHFCLLNPYNLRPAYWKFLLNLTDQNLKYIGRKYFKVFGYNSDWILEKDEKEGKSNDKNT